jgi:hypothetical protein
MSGGTPTTAVKSRMQWACSKYPRFSAISPQAAFGCFLQTEPEDDLSWPNPHFAVEAIEGSALPRPRRRRSE